MTSHAGTQMQEALFKTIQDSIYFLVKQLAESVAASRQRLHADVPVHVATVAAAHLNFPIFVMDTNTAGPSERHRRPAIRAGRAAHCGRGIVTCEIAALRGVNVTLGQRLMIPGWFFGWH